MKKRGPVILGTVASLVVIFSRYFAAGVRLNLPALTDQWVQLTYAASALLGLISLTTVHAKNVQRRRTTWPFDLALLAAMFAYAAWGLVHGNRDPVYQWLYNGVLVPLSATIYSLLAFYIASAAYRAFRLRTPDAAIMLGAAFIVMLGSVPLGEALTPAFAELKNWLMRVPQSAAFRGIQIGASLGGFATCLRILLGIERAHLSGSDL